MAAYEQLDFPRVAAPQALSQPAPHHDGPPAYYAKLAKALKPDGRIVDIYFFKKDLPVGAPAMNPASTF